jgi:hypothetical protein
MIESLDQMHFSAMQLSDVNCYARREVNEYYKTEKCINSCLHL